MSYYISTFISFLGEMFSEYSLFLILFFFFFFARDMNLAQDQVTSDGGLCEMILAVFILFSCHYNPKRIVMLVPELGLAIQSDWALRILFFFPLKCMLLSTSTVIEEIISFYETKIYIISKT